MHFETYQQLSGLLHGQWRWRLKAANGKIIADSGESYFNKVDCLQAITLVMNTNDRTPIK